MEDPLPHLNIEEEILQSDDDMVDGVCSDEVAEEDDIDFYGVECLEMPDYIDGYPAAYYSEKPFLIIRYPKRGNKVEVKAEMLSQGTLKPVEVKKEVV